jgi:hypothetical protein
VIPPQLVVSTAVARADVKTFVLRRVSGHPEGDTHEPTGIGCRTGAGLTGDLHFSRAVMESGGKHNDPASFTVLRGHQFYIGSRCWHHPNGFATLVSHRLGCNIVRLQTFCGIKREGLPHRASAGHQKDGSQYGWHRDKSNTTHSPPMVL